MNEIIEISDETTSPILSGDMTSPEVESPSEQQSQTQSQPQSQSQPQNQSHSQHQQPQLNNGTSVQPTVKIVYKYSKLSLRETLLYLNSQIDQLFALKQTPNSSDNLKSMYRKSILPHLLQIRRQNRQEKNDLESKYEKAKKLNQKLYDLQESCECLAFQASCLKSEVSSVREKFSSDEVIAMDIESTNEINYRFDVNAVAKLDHETRMRRLDEEEARRKELMEKLKKLDEDTKTIEVVCTQSEHQLNQVKPSIRQLLDKVGPTLQPSKPVG